MFMATRAVAQGSNGDEKEIYVRGRKKSVGKRRLARGDNVCTVHMAHSPSGSLGPAPPLKLAK